MRLSFRSVSTRSRCGRHRPQLELGRQGNDLWAPRGIRREDRSTRRRPSTDSRDQRVVDHLHLVPPIARAVRAALRSHVELEDLVAYGTEGLLAAASRFDTTRGVPFEAFARLRIQGAIVDGIRKEGWFGRRAYRRLTAARVGTVDSAANDPRSAVVLPAGLTILHAGHGAGAVGDDWCAEIAEGREADNGARWNGRRMVQSPVEDDDALRVTGSGQSFPTART